MYQSLRNKMYFIMLLLSMGMNLTGAAEITWTGPMPMTLPDVVGPVIEAVNVGGEAVTVGDIEFVAGPGEYTNIGEIMANTWFPGATGAKTGNTDLDKVLQSCMYNWVSGNAAGPVTLTLKNLTPGLRYRVQFYGVDARSCCGSPNYYYEDEQGNASEVWNRGSTESVMGEFTADAVTQNIIWKHESGDTNPIMNAIVLSLGQLPVQAVNPLPLDASVDVLRDGTVLEWASGASTVEHEVYIGTDFDEVYNATVDSADIYQDRVTENAYALNRLTLGETYFWRIDEVNDAHPDKRWKGNVWSFEVEPEAIVAANVSVTASSTADPNLAGPVNLINGSGLSDGKHDTNPSHMWVSDIQDGLPVTVEFDLGQAYKLHELTIWNYNALGEGDIGVGAKDVSIQVADSNEGPWTAVTDVVLTGATGKPDLSPMDVIAMQGVVASQVRLVITSNQKGLLQKTGLAEVQLSYLPVVVREMMPADGSTVNPTDVVLTWRAGRESGTHELYLDTDPNAVLEGTAPMVPLTDNSYVPVMDLEATYYWKVNEVNTVETPTVWEGPVQRLVTQASIMVDDMESYPTDEEVQIWQAWVDGFDNNNMDNGSVVGDNEGLPERTIVYEGSQSLNMQYGVNAQPDSWATHTFDPAEDWSKHGVQSLSLYFLGETTNTGGQLYVKIDDTEFTYDVAGDIQAGQWIPWAIDLTGISTVNRLMIGVKGGNGKIYVDNIRLYAQPVAKIEPVTPDAAGLAFEYLFEGDFKDSSSNGHHGTPLGDTAITTDSLQGQVAVFDGFDDAIDVPLVETSPAFTLGMWVNLTNDNLAGYHNLYGTNDWTEGSIHFRIRDGYVNADLFGLGSLVGRSPIASNEWVHVAYTVERSDIQYTRVIYLNGIQEGIRLQNVDPEVPHSGDIGGAVIGAWSNGGDLQREFTGMVDTVQMYNRALTAAEAAGMAGRTASYCQPF